MLYKWNNVKDNARIQLWNIFLDFQILEKLSTHVLGERVNIKIQSYKQTELVSMQKFGLAALVSLQYYIKSLLFCSRQGGLSMNENG